MTDLSGKVPYQAEKNIGTRTDSAWEKLQQLTNSLQRLKRKFFPQKREMSDELKLRTAIKARCHHGIYDLCNDCQRQYQDMIQPGMNL